MGLSVPYLDDRGGRLRAGFLQSGGAVRRARRKPRALFAAMWPVYLYLLACWILLTAVAFAVMILVPILHRWIHLIPAVLIPAGILAALVLVLRPLFLGRAFELHRRGWLSLALCPSCGYELIQLEHEEDGCRVCPECGAAWKLGDPVSPPPS